MTAGATPASVSLPPSPELQPDASVGWQLVQRMQHGDIDAMGEFWKLYYHTISVHMYSRVQNKEDAQDLTTETFIRAFRTVGHFKWVGHDPSAWLRTIARNLVIDYYRSAHKNRSVPVDFSDGSNQWDEDTAVDSPYEACMNKVQYETLYDLIMQLTPAQQKCLYYRYFLDMRFPEIAQAMGYKLEAVKSLAFRAIQTLRRTWPEE